MNKFSDFSNFSRLFEENGGDVEATLKAAAEEFIKSKGNEKGMNQKTDFIIKAASSVAGLEDPTKKIQKASRELDYDSSVMDSLMNAIIPYLDKRGKAPSGFDIFWQTLKKSLSRLSETDNASFLKIVDGIKEKKVDLDIKSGIHSGDIFKSIKDTLVVSGSHVDNFLNEVYAINVKMGNNPSGKGEYILDLFIKDAVKSSDVKIGDIEYEIKTDANAAIGESLGAKITYRENLMRIYEDGTSEKFDYVSMSFGKKAFRETWAPQFVEFTIKHPDSAKAFLEYQYKFFLQPTDKDSAGLLEFREIVSNYLATPSPEGLPVIYDFLIIEYMKKALSAGEIEKSMLIFEEDKDGATGKFVVFDYNSIEEAVSFSGSDRKSIVKIQLPKSSATMRPEITHISV